jgi:hypothetical protein
LNIVKIVSSKITEDLLMLKVFLYIEIQSPRRHCWCQLVMLLIIKRLKDEALMVRKDSDIDTIKDTIKLIQLLVTSLKVTRYY